ncbi:hypothetical protein Hokovirus_3_250 [Hokovirus HKV1]|uniref:Uncharacterized protein n=1 Tax=Hokovirus HKV1 TaxID=1977638 RepID=A0A1V0SGY8_9VIRU|nr:hypothetical protein Hokovirus_3_250 [Hokovirus HKV1]
MIPYTCDNCNIICNDYFHKVDELIANNIPLCEKCFYKTMLKYKFITRKFTIPEKMLQQLNVRKLYNKYNGTRYYINDIKKYLKNKNNGNYNFGLKYEIKNILKILINKTSTDLNLKPDYLENLDIMDILEEYAKTSIDIYADANDIYIKYVAPDLFCMRAKLAKKEYIDKYLYQIYKDNVKYIIKEQYYKKLLTLTEIEKKQTLINENTFIDTLEKISNEHCLIYSFIEKNKRIDFLKRDIKEHITCPKKRGIIFNTLKNKYYSNILNNISITHDELINNLKVMNRNLQVFNLLTTISHYLRVPIKQGIQNFIYFRILYLTFYDEYVRKYVNYGTTIDIDINKDDITVDKKKLSYLEILLLYTIIKYNSKTYRDIPKIKEYIIKSVKNRTGPDNFLLYGHHNIYSMVTSETPKYNTILKNINNLVNHYEHLGYFYLIN